MARALPIGFLLRGYESMVNNRQRLGTKGEDIAVLHLESKGYRVVGRNFRCRLGEIDIIARDGQFLVFIEVKTRRSLAFGDPTEAVTLKKQQQISRVAMYYIGQLRSPAGAVRFDVVSVIVPGNGNPKVDIIENAFDCCQ